MLNKQINKRFHPSHFEDGYNDYRICFFFFNWLRINNVAYI